MINEFSKIVKIFSLFNIRACDFTSGNRRKVSLIAINSARRRCNLLIPYVFCKKVCNLAPGQWWRFHPRDKVCALLPQSLEFPPFPLSYERVFARNAIGRTAADASVRSCRSDIRKRMLNSHNKASYNRSTALHIVNPWSVCCLNCILFVIRIIHRLHYSLYYICIMKIKKKKIWNSLFILHTLLKKLIKL